MHSAITVLAAGMFVASPAVAADEQLIVVAPWKIAALTPAASGGVLQRMGVTEPLTRPVDGGAIDGLLAASWEANDALTKWRFSIRAGVTFHDGAALTAAVVADNLNAFRGESALSRAPVESIVADGDEVVISLSRPFAPLPAYLAHWSTGILSPADLDGAADGEIAGTGYYRIDGGIGEQEFSVSAHDGYWGDRPSIAEARYLSIADADSRFSLLAAGEAHLAFGLHPSAIARGEGQERFEVQVEPLARIRALKVNAGAPPFADRAVREAISLAIDRQGIATALLGNADTASTQLLPPNIAGWHDPALPAFRYDPAEAAALLDGAGWQMGDDGVRMKDGKRLAFELFAYDARPELPGIATAVAAQLAEVGIEATIRLGEWTEIPERHEDGSLEMAIFSDNFAYVPDPVGAIAANYTGGGAAWGALGWQSDAFDEKVAAYQATVDPERRAALRREIVATLHEEKPVIVVAWYDEVYGISTEVTGFTFDPFEMDYGLNEVSWRAAE